MASLPASIRHSRKDFQHSFFFFFFFFWEVWRRHDFAVAENGRVFRSRSSDKRYTVGSSLLCDLDWRLGLN